MVQGAFPVVDDSQFNITPLWPVNDMVEAIVPEQIGLVPVNVPPKVTGATSILNDIGAPTHP